MLLRAAHRGGVRVKITCPKCSRVIGDTQSNLDAHINCKRCGEQEIHVRTATFKDYIKAPEAEETTK